MITSFACLISPFQVSWPLFFCHTSICPSLCHEQTTCSFYCFPFGPITTFYFSDTAAWVSLVARGITDMITVLLLDLGNGTPWGVPVLSPGVCDTHPFLTWLPLHSCEIQMSFLELSETVTCHVQLSSVSCGVSLTSARVWSVVKSCGCSWTAHSCDPLHWVHYILLCNYFTYKYDDSWWSLSTRGKNLSCFPPVDFFPVFNHKLLFAFLFSKTTHFLGGWKQCTTLLLCSKYPTSSNCCLPYFAEKLPLSRAWSHAGVLCIFDTETPEASPEMCVSK